ncbi:MAG: hypothetical protein WAV47_01300 [Blastocatellia bacterium]
MDPRPITQLVSSVEKTLLAESDNPKKLVDAYLRISDTHLQVALNAIKANNHLVAERELDIYNKAVAAAGKEAFALQDGKRSVSKKVEQSLYKQIKMLETIDRLFPAEREAFSDAALKQAKQLRVQALNEAFASGEVLKDPDEEKRPKSDPPAKDPPIKNKPGSPPLALRSAVPFKSGGTIWASALRVLGRVADSSEAQVRWVTELRCNPERAGQQAPGDYLTEEEDDHVREAQLADHRVKVFMRIAERRLKAIAAPPTQSADKRDQKKVDEEQREWGALPKLSRADLLRHYARAISECMAKLEDSYERNPKSSALPKALGILRDSTDKHLQTLNALKPEMTAEDEVTALRDAIDEAETANKGARAGLK